MDPALTELLLRSEEDDEDQVVEAIIRLRNPSVDVPGVRVVSRFGSIATCRLAVSSIRDVWAHPGVVSLKAPRSLGPDNETASRSTKLRPTDTRRPPHLPVAGSGVVVAAVDWGLDFDHPNFKNPDGTTRLLALWDQRDDSGDSPEPYGYGKLHTRDQIDRALGTSDPYQALGYQPSRADAGGGTHGTHVLDIAAGNGRAGGPVGMAPKAELVFVDLADRDTGGLANLGGSVRLCEAVDFIARTAGPRPWVINLSIGRHGGPHDGKTLIELALDELLDAAPGRFIAQSTGNYYRAGAHACGVLAEGQSRSIHFVVDPADITDNELEIWYDGRDEFTVRVDPPKGIGPVIALGTRADLADADGRLIGRVHHRARDPNNGDNHIDVFLYEPGPFGVWTVTLSATHSEHGRFDAWLERDEKCPGCQTRFITNDRNPTTTTGTIANSHLPLIVGAYDAHRKDRPVARFSSSGPTRDGRRKPDIAAPGVGVLAARSAPKGAPRSPGRHIRKSGSSMATPHVTGAVALCMQAAGSRVSARRIRALVLGTADPASLQRNRIGRGYLNIPALVAAALRTRSLTAPDTREESTMASAADAHDTLTSAPATAYREMLYRADGPLSTAIGGHYAIVARPGERAAAPPARGDVLVTVTLGKAGGGRCDVLLDGQLRRRGWYAMTSRGTVQGRLRRILDARGCVPPGHLLLRPLRSYGDAPPNESESVPGPCPDVAVPPSSRPKLLYRNSTHPAVREAQRKLNAFHATRIAAGLPGLDAAPLVDDCIFGENTEKALKSFQRIVFPGQPKQHDRILGPLTWAQLDLVGPPGPPPPPPPPPPPVPVPAPPSPKMTSLPPTRGCCLLWSQQLAGISTVGDSTSMSPGTVYTGRAGFVDFGHLWDICFLTAWIFQNLHEANGAAGTKFDVGEGTVTLTNTAPPDEFLVLARAIAYDEGLAHEISSYWVCKPGMHNSSFSPEDLCSNFLGTLVAERALLAGGPFVAAAHTEGKRLLTDLDGQDDKNTAQAFSAIAGRWVTGGLLQAGCDDYLRRRNFTRIPWKAGHPSDAPTPAFVTDPVHYNHRWNYIHKARGFSRADMPAEMSRVMVDASVRYKPDFDQP